MATYATVANSTKADGSREISVTIAGGAKHNVFVAQKAIDDNGAELTWEQTCDLVAANVQASLGAA